MRRSGLLLVCVFLKGIALAQHYTPQIERCPCLMKVDPRLKTVCGYLVVPENRNRPSGNKVKVPFLFARRPDQDSVKNIVLYTTGGPGYATINVGDSLRFNSDNFAFGGFLFFDQRGTRNAIPCLDCESIDEAIRDAYRYGLKKDSLIGVAVTKCRKKFEKKGIDLSAYNTVESAADIADLKKALKIDSLTLFGISYSGGLMLSVLRDHPEGIKSLLLNSPLPSYVNYEEHALFNHQEALNELFNRLENDSIQNAAFPNLQTKFQEYFTSLQNSQFNFTYTERNGNSWNIRYSRNELLDAVFNRMNNGEFHTVPGVIYDLINGNHASYVKQVLDDKFSGNQNLAYGMRLSVYCSEQILYSDLNKIKLQDKILPWLAGYPFNNVNHALCDCWKVKPEPEVVKTPVYSNVPALISAGMLDPWTRPFYNRLIKRTMPNAHLIMLKQKAHVAGFDKFVSRFMTNPYKPLTSTSSDVIVE